RFLLVRNTKGRTRGRPATCSTTRNAETSRSGRSRPRPPPGSHLDGRGKCRFQRVVSERRVPNQPLKFTIYGRTGAVATSRTAFDSASPEVVAAEQVRTMGRLQGGVPSIQVADQGQSVDP